MATPKDIFLDSSGDLAISKGDFVIGDATAQHKAFLLISQKGEWKQNPQVGVGIGDFIQDDGLAELEKEIRAQFTNDGMRVGKIEVFEDGSFTADASYK